MIIRHGRRDRFLVVTQETVNDAELSFRARGVLLWLLDKPDNWECRSETIAKAGPEGRDAIRTALRELETRAYLVRNRVQLPNGQWITETWIYEHPETIPAPEIPSSDRGLGTQPSVDQAFSSSLSITKTEAKQRRRTQIPETFIVTDEMWDWARHECPSIDSELQTKRFVNYWKGSGGVKADWVRTWKTWMLGEEAKVPVWARSRAGAAR